MTLLHLPQLALPESAARVHAFNKRVLLSASLICLAALTFSGSLFAQDSETENTVSSPALAQTNAVMDVLPSQKLGADDLLQILVPYCPELSHSFRVSSDGTLALPLLKQRIQVAGFEPSQVESKIAAALVNEQVLTEPTVNISVLEYRSKPVSVVGAVNRPLTFQATGDTTLLDALAKAGGLSANVGPTITVTHRGQLADGTLHVTVQSIPVRELIGSTDPKLNVKLTGNEEVRVPEAGHIFVAGNVKKPGSFAMQDNADTTVVKALALSEGLQAYSAKLAYIYREQGTGKARQEITVPLKEIMARKAPDVVLEADDILYVPENGSERMTAKVLAGLAGFGTQAGAGLLIYH